MQSPYKKIIVYDLETGGFSSEINGITEIAMVAIDLETLEIVDKFSTLIKPRLNLQYMASKDGRQLAKMLYKNLGVKDPDSGVKVVNYRGEKVTLKNLDRLEQDIENFKLYLDNEHGSHIVEYDELIELEQESEFEDIMEILFDHTYNPQALEATHIPRSLFEDGGVEYAEAFSGIKDFINKHTHGNSKPIIAGHNIGSLPRRIVKGKEKGPDGFDNPFMELLFADFNDDFFDSVNEYIIDTLKEARRTWFEAPSHNLGTCANMLGITLKEAHRALPDTVANAKVLIKMLKQQRGEGVQASKYQRRKYNFNF